MPTNTPIVVQAAFDATRDAEAATDARVTATARRLAWQVANMTPDSHTIPQALADYREAYAAHEVAMLAMLEAWKAWEESRAPRRREGVDEELMGLDQ